MKAFRFPLDRALHLRRLQLELEQAKLQQLARDRDQLDLRATAIRSDAARTRAASTSQPQISSIELAALPGYQTGVRNRLSKLDGQKRDILKRIEDQRRVTLEAERKVKLLEQLREKRYADWSALMNREQEAFAAEAYLARWSPNQ